MLPAFLIAFGLIGTAWAQPTTLPSRFEAEDAGLQDGAAVKSDKLASGGSFVQLFRTGSITWRVTTPLEGRYELILRYRTGAGDRAEVLSINGAPRGIGFAMSANDWVEMKTVRHLKAGENEITLKADWGQIDIDLMRFDLQPRGRIDPLVESPQIRPRRNTYYRNSTADPQLLLEPGSHKLLAVIGPKGAIPFETTAYPHVDDALTLRLSRSGLDQLETGPQKLSMQFDGGVKIPFELDVRSEPAAAPWTIVTLNINHGTAVVMKTPSGKIAVIDVAKAAYAESVLVPFLKQNGIKKIDYLFITHFHEDHNGGLPLVEKTFEIGRRWDYNNVKVNDVIDVDGIKTTVLNSKESGEEENTRSLSLRMEYNGFVYQHTGDTYGQNEVQHLAMFPPEMLRANLLHANHHFHGSVDASFCRVVDPELVIVSAQEAVYARAAFMTIYREKVEQYLKSVNARLRETLLTLDIGHIVVRIRSGEDWSYETSAALDGIKLK